MKQTGLYQIIIYGNTRVFVKYTKRHDIILHEYSLCKD